MLNERVLAVSVQKWRKESCSDAFSYNKQYLFNLFLINYEVILNSESTMSLNRVITKKQKGKPNSPEE